MNQTFFTLMLYVVALSPLAAVCQDAPVSTQPVTGATLQMPAHTPAEVVIPLDTQVQLRLLEGLSTATDHKGYIVHFEVASDVVADGIVVVPAGTRTTVKLTHAGSRIEFSDPKLSVDGRKLRLSEHTAAERGEIGAETGAAIGMLIVDAPLLAIQIPIQAVSGVAHAVRSDHKREPTRYVTMEKGETFTYYVRDMTRVSLSGH